jgi:23S rRNA maturation-related 3'-5' exoribonuclease YhaM
MDLVEKTANEQQILSDKEIERTIEKIIQSKYADTIERMVAHAVEKAVTQEIEKIKRSLPDNEPPT